MAPKFKDYPPPYAYCGVHPERVEEFPPKIADLTLGSKVTAEIIVGYYGHEIKDGKPFLVGVDFSEDNVYEATSVTYEEAMSFALKLLETMAKMPKISIPKFCCNCSDESDHRYRWAAKSMLPIIHEYPCLKVMN